MSCFQGLLFCPEAASLLLHNFCIYHISPPGHEVLSKLISYIFFCYFVIFIWYFCSLLPFATIVQLGATPISPSTPVQSVDELADQVADVLDFFGYTDSQFFFVIVRCFSHIFELISLWLFQIGFCNVLRCQRWCIHSYSLRSMCLYRSGLFSTACTINSYLYPFLQTKYRERVLGLILVSPLYKTPSWTEWFYNKVAIQYIATSTLFINSSY
jgi:hypothetical protein